MSLTKALLLGILIGILVGLVEYGFLGLAFNYRQTDEQIPNWFVEWGLLGSLGIWSVLGGIAGIYLELKSRKLKAEPTKS